MYTPDRVIVRKIREYDPHLFIQWNPLKGYFELWREMPHGRRLITPITQDIYNASMPQTYVQLDERLLWWIDAADSWKSGGAAKHAMESDNRWIEFQKKQQKKFKDYAYDAAKDGYNHISAFYATKHESKNSNRPTFKNAKRSNWIRPDSAGMAGPPRMFARTAGSARKLNFQR